MLVTQREHQARTPDFLNSQTPTNLHGFDDAQLDPRSCQAQPQSMGGDQARHPQPGDIVVTKVADHYHVSRAMAGGTAPSVSIQAMDRLGDALTLACQLVTGSPRRVFLYDRGDRPHHTQIDCAKPYWLK